MIDYYMPQLQAIKARIRSRACLTTIATTERYRQYRRVQNLQYFGSLCHTWGVWIHGTQSRGVWCCRAGDSRQWGCLLEAEEAQLMPLSTSLSLVYDFMTSNCYRTDWTKKQLRFLKMTLRWPRRMLAEQWPNLNQFWSPATVVHLARSIGDSKPWNTCCFQRDGSSRNCVVICLRLIVIW